MGGRTRSGHGSDEVAIEAVAVSAYRVPTDGPDGRESDGTLEWDSTTIVVAEVHAGGQHGLGYSYAHAAAAYLIADKLGECILGKDALAVGERWHEQVHALRNIGCPGIGAMAVSALDVALWDLKAKLLELPLYVLLNPFRSRVPIYGSGGFCNYPLTRLASQLAGWVEQGIPRVKLKISRHPAEDPARLDACRAAVGNGVDLMADANGALDRKRGLYWAERLSADWNVCWFEEPVPSADREGLHLIRARGPAGLDIAAGEYGYVVRDFADLLAAESVDCLQADVTRCGGITGLLQIAGLCAASAMDLSAHCAPAISAHAFCAVERARHIEYFHDHVRIEHLLFDGVPQPQQGMLGPDASREGLGLSLKRQDAERYRVFQSGKS